MKKISLVLFALFSLGIAGCSNDGPSMSGKLELSEPESRAAEEVKSFGVEFFKALNGSEVKNGAANENLVCSPLSAMMNLAMLANICEDDLKSELLKVLGCYDMTSLNELNNKIMREFPEIDDKCDVALANSFWYSKDFDVYDNFERIGNDYYDCRFFKKDMISSGIVKEINKWVSDKTRGHIPDFLHSAPGIMALINALYFKGEWSDAFAIGETKDETFHGMGGTKNVKMMHKNSNLPAYVCDDFKVVQLNFGSEAYNVRFILPSENISIDNFISSDKLDEALSVDLTSKIEVRFGLPRTELDPKRNVSLPDALAEMGIKNLTIQNLNVFGSKFDNDGSVIDIQQRATLQFDEKGAVATAVTGSLMYGANPSVPDYIEIILNRPYILFISESTTGLPLFAAKVVSM